MAVLCNQGCGTHVFFKDKRPYNVLDKKKHVCPMLEMAKFWGGFYDTIPMGRIRSRIQESHSVSYQANISRNVDDILDALQITCDNLQYVIAVMEDKAKENAVWAGQLEGYKKQLIEDQRRREERKLTLGV